jgi:hypothetical protein
MASVDEQDELTEKWIAYGVDDEAGAEACRGRVRFPTNDQMVDGDKEQRERLGRAHAIDIEIPTHVALDGIRALGYCEHQLYWCLSASMYRMRLVS